MVTKEGQKRNTKGRCVSEESYLAGEAFVPHSRRERNHGRKQSEIAT